MILPATITIETAGGRTVHLAETAEVAKNLAQEGHLSLTPAGIEALAAIASVFPGSKVVGMKNLAKERK